MQTDSDALRFISDLPSRSTGLAGRKHRMAQTDGRGFMAVLGIPWSRFVARAHTEIGPQANSFRPEFITKRLSVFGVSTLPPFS